MTKRESIQKFSTNCLWKKEIFLRRFEWCGCCWSISSFYLSLFLDEELWDDELETKENKLNWLRIKLNRTIARYSWRLQLFCLIEFFQAFQKLNRILNTAKKQLHFTIAATCREWMRQKNCCLVVGVIFLIQIFARFRSYWKLCYS